MNYGLENGYVLSDEEIESKSAEYESGAGGGSLENIQAKPDNRKTVFIVAAIVIGILGLCCVASIIGSLAFLRSTQDVISEMIQQESGGGINDYESGDDLDGDWNPSDVLSLKLGEAVILDKVTIAVDIDPGQYDDKGGIIHALSVMVTNDSEQDFEVFGWLALTDTGESYIEMLDVKDFYLESADGEEIGKPRMVEDSDGNMTVIPTIFQPGETRSFSILYVVESDDAILTGLYIDLYPPRGGHIGIYWK